MEWKITVTPGSKKNLVTQTKPGVLEVKLKAKPERNLANELLKLVLAEYFNVPVSQIHLLTGHHTRHKRITINQTTASSSPPVR